MGGVQPAHVLRLDPIGPTRFHPAKDDELTAELPPLILETIHQRRLPRLVLILLLLPGNWIL